jgi:hypothetical protein
MSEQSPNKSSKQKLAKLLGEESMMETEREPFRPPLERSPFYLGNDYADEDIIMNPDGTVKAGTLAALVERLTTHEQPGEVAQLVLVENRFTNASARVRLHIHVHLPDHLPVICKRSRGR